MSKIISYLLNGNTYFVHPGSKSRLPGETEDSHLNRLKIKDVPVGATDIQTIDSSVLPTDRTFRKAWKVVNGTHDYDIDKAKERLRELRDQLFSVTDTAYLQNVMKDANENFLLNLKIDTQKLRDLPQRQEFVTATTIQPLIDLYLEGLAIYDKYKDARTPSNSNVTKNPR